jgi:hypothetical protein
MNGKASGHDTGVPADSIDGYAKAHGISREEAAKRMRAQLVPSGDSNAEKASYTATATMPEGKNQ